jgi:hypothetical protein
LIFHENEPGTIEIYFKGVVNVLDWIALLPGEFGTGKFGQTDRRDGSYRRSFLPSSSNLYVVKARLTVKML